MKKSLLFVAISFTYMLSQAQITSLIPGLNHDPMKGIGIPDLNLRENVPNNIKTYTPESYDLFACSHKDIFFIFTIDKENTDGTTTVYNFLEFYPGTNIVKNPYPANLQATCTNEACSTNQNGDLAFSGKYFHEIMFHEPGRPRRFEMILPNHLPSGINKKVTIQVRLKDNGFKFNYNGLIDYTQGEFFNINCKIIESTDLGE